MSSEQQLFVPTLSINQTSKQNATTITGGLGKGNGLNQLCYPCGISIDDDQTIYIVDTNNHRILQTKKNSNNIRIVAGGNGQGKRNDQLDRPTKVIIDHQNGSLIICDRGNRRVVRWSHQTGRTADILISNIDCCDLKMDNERFLYVSDIKKHEVRRWKIGEKNGTIVASGKGQGNRLDQFNGPFYIFIDEEHSVYVSDYHNHRVMKWVKGAEEGIVVAGGQGQGNGLRQLHRPWAIVVDQLGTLYITDYCNYRVMRWSKGAEQGTIIVGGNGRGEQSYQLNGPIDLSFDRENNLYVVEYQNHRVQRFDVN